MNKKMIFVFSVLLLLVTACQPATSTPEAVTIHPTVALPSAEDVVNSAMNAWNIGDVSTLKTLFADDATVCFPDWGDECTAGAEAVDTWIEELVAANFAIESESLKVEGNTVTVVAKVWADPTRALEIAPLVTTDVYTVQDGKIINQTSTLTEESSKKLMAAMADAQTSGVVMAYVEAINAGDVDTAMNLLHEDIYVEMAPTLSPGFPTIFGTEDVIRTWLEEMMAVNLKVSIEDVTVFRSTVTVKSNISSDYLQSLQIDSLPMNETFVIRDSQILSIKRVIPPASINKIQGGLVGLGTPETITPELGEVLASEISDIAGLWIGTITGVGEGPMTFDENGTYEMSGDSGSFWFNGPFLWMRTDRVHVPGDHLHSCLDAESIGSYVVYVTRSGDQPVELRMIPILEPCMLRSAFLGGENLTLR